MSGFGARFAGGSEICAPKEDDAEPDPRASGIRSMLYLGESKIFWMKPSNGRPCVMVHLMPALVYSPSLANKYLSARSSCVMLAEEYPGGGPHTKRPIKTV